MVGELQPGRAANLTPDQEEKLREFWKATLKVFGVPLSDVVVLGDDTNGNLETENNEEMEEEVIDGKTGEKKKKRLGIFRRKKKDDKENKEAKDNKENHTAKEIKAEKSAPSVHDMPKGDAEDKYGQTKEFHLALANNAPEDLRNAFWSMVKHDHPDSLLLRFLRARKWDIERALVMMISTMHWRLNEQHVDDDIMKNGELGALEQSLSSDAAVKKEGEGFIAQLRMGKSFIHGLDSGDRPICIVRVRLHKAGEQSERSLEKVTVHVIETARLLLVPPVDTATIIFDMTGFSMANMDYNPLKFMIKCFEANYPESLGTVLVHKAPWVFQGIWKIIRGWLDPVVAGKVHFTNDVKELEAFIPRSHIISDLGGDEKYTYKYPEPQPGENDAMNDVAKRDSLLEARAAVVREFEDTTKEWIHGPLGDASVQERRAATAEKLRVGYWELDPYVRARSQYDRLGVIGKGGKLTFYPAEEGPEGGAASEAKEEPAADTSKDGEHAKLEESSTPAAHEDGGVD